MSGITSGPVGDRSGHGRIFLFGVYVVSLGFFLLPRCGNALVILPLDATRAPAWPPPGSCLSLTHTNISMALSFVATSSSMMLTQSRVLWYLASSDSACHKILRIDDWCANVRCNSHAFTRWLWWRSPIVVCHWRKVSTSVIFETTLQWASSNIRTGCAGTGL